jgi:hypothetical protein
VDAPSAHEFGLDAILDDSNFVLRGYSMTCALLFLKSWKTLGLLVVADADDKADNRMIFFFQPCKLHRKQFVREAEKWLPADPCRNLGRYKQVGTCGGDIHRSSSTLFSRQQCSSQIDAFPCSVAPTIYCKPGWYRITDTKDPKLRRQEEPVGMREANGRMIDV